jgi:large subunit ribosomal protein L35
MPKQKTHSRAKKTFKVSGTGKLMSRGQMSGNLRNKSPKQKRQLGKEQPVDTANEKTVDRMLGRR